MERIGCVIRVNLIDLMSNDDIIYLGESEDMAGHTLHAYTDGVLLFLAYNGISSLTPGVYVTCEFVSKIKDSPSDYAFTPYSEFVHLV